MSTLSITHPHKLSLDELKPKVEQLAASLQEKYGARSQWQGNNTLKLKATGVEGTLKLEEQCLTIDVTLGMLASFMKPKIEAEIRNYLSTSV